MDGEALRSFFEVDSVLAGTVAKEGSVSAADDAKTVGVFFQKIGGQDIELSKNLNLQRSG